MLKSYCGTLYSMYVYSFDTNTEPETHRGHKTSETKKTEPSDD